MKKGASSALAVTALLALSAAPAWTGDNKKGDVDEIGNRRVAHRSIISQEKEISIGKEFSQEIDHSAKVLADPAVNEYINRVAQNLARNSDLTIPVTVKIIDSPEINAFALPGGFVYINTGTLLAADEEDQIAGVLAHELAHVAARHWASQMTKATILQYAMLPLLFTPLSYGVYYGVVEAYLNGVPLAFLKFTRNAEAEADYLGIQYMYKAGYDPNAYVGFFSKVLEEERRSPGSIPSVFASHPPTPDRILKSEEEIKEIIPKREQYLVTNSEFDDMKARLQAVISNRRRMQKGETGQPTLQKRAPTTDSTTAKQAPPDDKGKDQGGDKPPVLQRRDN